MYIINNRIHITVSVNLKGSHDIGATRTPVNRNSTMTNVLVYFEKSKFLPIEKYYKTTIKNIIAPFLCCETIRF